MHFDITQRPITFRGELQINAIAAYEHGLDSSLDHSRVWRLDSAGHGQDQAEVEAHAQRVLCILMPRRHRHLELSNLGHGLATGTGSQAEPIRVEPVERCLCWCYFHCKQMMRNTQTHSSPNLAICGMRTEGKETNDRLKLKSQ